MIRICCQCQRWESPTGWRWSFRPVGRETHGLCPTCFKAQMSIVRRHKP